MRNELVIRIGFFFGVLILMGVWEFLAPRRTPTISKARRWVSNLAIVVLNSLVLRILFPTAAVGMAAFSQREGWGLFNYFHVPGWIASLVSVLAMDLVIYLQHVMFHAVPLFWRLHRVHHADLDYDVTTGIRFHPIEIILSMLIKISTIIVLGAPVMAVIVFEVLLNATAMFNHGNVRLHRGVDKFLRLVLVTPDMHRVHHSIEEDEANSNFGFSLPWWDRGFGTYRDQPRAGHEGMTLGIHAFRDAKQVNGLLGMLLLPLVGKTRSYSINRDREKGR